METKLLYGLDKSGKHKVWSIWTEGEMLCIEHGSENGKMQTKCENIQGKNIGRANETTPEKQAELEAESRWRKQIDKGYRETKEELEELPLLPMLAADYLKQGHRIKYPCYASAKLDGVRCLAIRHHNEVQLKSRGGKDYSVPHIQQELMYAMQPGDVWDHVANTHFDVCYGDFEERKRQLNNVEDYKGKWLTVKYQTRYKDSKLPQFPTGVVIRECNADGNPIE